MNVESLSPEGEMTKDLLSIINRVRATMETGGESSPLRFFDVRVTRCREILRPSISGLEMHA
jgi:hypothetical protein